MAKITKIHNEPKKAPTIYLETEVDQKLINLDDKMRDTIGELEGARQELARVKAQNVVIEKKIEEAEHDKKILNTKLGSLKVKLGMSNANLNTCNDEKEALRTNLNEIEVLVARLEERLTASSSELDRLRDSGNPESNINIRKHVTNDKKEIKRLRVETNNERAMLEADNEMLMLKNEEIRRLEKELAGKQANLKSCEMARASAEAEEQEETKLMKELLEAYRGIQDDRKFYGDRLKAIKVKLGIATSGQNVNMKYTENQKRREKELNRRLNQIDKKVKDTNNELDVLKNQHKLSKTAQSINNYTKRTQGMRGDGTAKLSLAQSGKGPVKFATKTLKEETKVLSRSMNSLPSISEASSKHKGANVSTGKAKSEQIDPKRATRNNPERDSKRTQPNKPDQMDFRRAPRNKPEPIDSKQTLKNNIRQTQSEPTNRRNSVQFVPPPKSKLKQTPR